MIYIRDRKIILTYFEVIVNTIRDRIALIGARLRKINLDTMQTRLYKFEAHKHIRECNNSVAIIAISYIN
jgi:hypothetical protein